MQSRRMDAEVDVEEFIEGYEVDSWKVVEAFYIFLWDKRVGEYLAYVWLWG